MQASLFLAALFHLAVIVALAVLLTRRCVDGYANPSQLQTTERPGSVSLPVVTICPDQPSPSKLPREPTCLFSLTQGLNQEPQPVSIRPVSTKMRTPTGHEFEYSCYECNADRSAPLPATGISQLFVEVNRSRSGSAFAPNLVAYTGGAVRAALPTNQQQWVRLYQQESGIHQLTARKTQRLSGAVEVGFDVAPKSLPCSQATHQRDASCAGISALVVRYTTLDVTVTREVPTLDAVLALCALAGAASCLLVSLRGFARLLTGARGMPTEAETLHLIAASKPPPVFSDPYTGRQMAPAACSSS